MLSLPNSHVVTTCSPTASSCSKRRAQGLIVVDASTAEPDISAQLAARLRERGIEMMDGTISGTSEMFAEKNAIFMVGGSEGAYRHASHLRRGDEASLSCGTERHRREHEARREPRAVAQPHGARRRPDARGESGTRSGSRAGGAQAIRRLFERDGSEGRENGEARISSSPRAASRLPTRIRV